MDEEIFEFIDRDVPQFMQVARAADGKISFNCVGANFDGVAGTCRLDRETARELGMALLTATEK